MKIIPSNILACMLVMLVTFTSNAQPLGSNELPVRGFCIAAPKPSDVNAFSKFIKEELVPRKV
ncbi:MAG TPA: hypothetical protein VJ184_12270, partial [Chryseolinea sp.]|nr:hypothetical protein [Chryseolinea sp.]